MIPPPNDSTKPNYSQIPSSIWVHHQPKVSGQKDTLWSKCYLGLSNGHEILYTCAPLQITLLNQFQPIPSSLYEDSFNFAFLVQMDICKGSTRYIAPFEVKPSTHTHHSEWLRSDKYNAYGSHVLAIPQYKHLLHQGTICKGGAMWICLIKLKLSRPIVLPTLSPWDNLSCTP